MGQGETQAFGAQDFFVEGDIVGNGTDGGSNVGLDFGEGVGERDALGEGAFGGDAVDAGGVGGDGVAVGENDAVGRGDLVAGVIAEEPGELDHAGPIGEGAWREGQVPAPGQAGGLGVKEEEACVGGAVKIEHHIHVGALSLRRTVILRRGRRGRGGGVGHFKLDVIGGPGGAGLAEDHEGGLELFGPVDLHAQE